MTDPAFNLAQLEQRPNWYQHLDAVENAIAAEDELYRIRWQAGWTCDEGGWYAPDCTHEYDWILCGYPFPEEPGYQEWADAFWHYERLDSEQHADPTGSSVNAESHSHPE
jgi:hypothetical protein